MIRAFVVLLLALVAAQPAAARTDEDDGGDVRVVGRCGAGAQSELRLERDDGEIEVRLELRLTRGDARWRVTLVHENRVVWKSTAREARGGGTFDLRRTLPDLPGSDTVTAQARGPRGLGCRATATLADA
jgi:hypothetical protein